MKSSLLFTLALASYAKFVSGASFDSAATGDWIDLSSWTSGVAFPDTYANDSANLLTGHTINYSGGMSTPAGLIDVGGLAVSNGNVITVNGGVLTQATFPNEIRIGEGIGVTSGSGTLIIRNGGQVDTGASIGLAVGAKISGLQAGNGTFNLEDGLLLLGAGATTGGFGVGVDESSGVAYIGDGLGSAGTAVLDLATNNVPTGVGASLAGAGGTGTLNISSDGSMTFGTGGVFVGASGGIGTLDVASGGSVTGGAGILYVGEGSGSTGTLANAGSISTTGNIRIGSNHGSGTAALSAGTAATTKTINVGIGASATGVLEVSGTATVSVGNNLMVGDGGANGTLNQSGGTLNLNGGHLLIGGNAGAGNGTYNITAGSISNSNWFHIGASVGSTGTINVNYTNPADVLTTNQLYLGTGGGTGLLNVTSGTFSTKDVAEIGRYTGTGTLTVDGPDARVVGASDGGDPFFKIGRTGGHGFVFVKNGGKINTTNTWFTLGENDGSDGEATITGTNSEVKSHGLIVGWNGHAKGTLNIFNHASVTNVGHELSVGRDQPYTEGFINIDTEGTLTTHDARVGHNGKGTVQIDGGGTFHSNNGWAVVGDAPTAVGVINLNSGVFTVDSANPGDGTLIVANNIGAQGTVNQLGGVTNISNELNLARGGGTGIVTVAGGQMNVNGWTTMGRDGGGGTGTLNVASSGVFSHPQLGGDLLLGWKPGTTGNVNITDGGTMTYNWWIRAGVEGGSVGNMLVDGAGSILNHNQAGGDSRLVTGEAGTGTLRVSNGGQIIDGGNGFYVGWHNGSHGAVEVNSGAGLAVKTGWIQVGIEPGSNGTMTIDGVGSLVTHDIASQGHSTAIGQSGNGFLNISNGGQMNDTAARFLVGRDNGGYGEVNVSGGGSLIHLPTVDPNAEDWMMIVGGTHEGSQPVGGKALMNITGGSILKTNSFDAGRRSPLGGILNVTESTMTNSGHFSTGRGYNGVGGSTPGEVNLTSSTLSYSSWLSVGHEGGSGVLNITNSDITGNGDFNVGIDQNGAPSPTVGVVNMNGGNINVPTMPIGRSGGNGTFNENAGYVNVTNEVNVGNGTPTSFGTLNISGFGSTFLAGTVGDPFMFVGRGNGHGFVNVSNGGTLSTTGTWFAMGNGDNTSGETLVTGAGSTLTSHGFIVGWAGNGASGKVTISDNAVVTNTGHELSIARHPGTSGEVNIDSGGVFNAGPETRIAHGAPNGPAAGPAVGVVNINGGTINMQGGGWAMIAEGVTSKGTLNMSSGAVNVTADRFVIGVNAGAVAAFNQTGGATQIGNELNIGRGGSVGALNLDGGTLNVDGWTTLGRDGNGTGTLNITNGAVYTHIPSGGDFLGGWNNGSHTFINVLSGGKMTHNWWYRLAIDPGSNTEMLVDGAGSEVSTTTGRVYVGERGTGKLTVSNGGSFSQFSGDQFDVGGNDQSSTGDGKGEINILGGNVSTNNFIRVGFGNTGADPAEGTINLDSGSLSSGGWIGFGHEGGDGALNMSNGTITTGSEFYVGIDDNGHVRSTTGLANVSGGSISVGTTLWVGRNGGSGVLNLIGLDPTSVTSAGRTVIGEGGVFSGGNRSHGSLNFDNPNGALNAKQLEIAINGGAGELTLDNGEINVGAEYISVGRNGGDGVVNLHGGTIKFNNWMTLGHENGTGTLNMSGGTINGTGDLDLAVAGGTTNMGVVNQTGGSVVITSPGNVVIGRDSAGVAIYNLLGGLLEAPEVQVARSTADATKTGTLNAWGGTIFTNDIHIDTRSAAGSVSFDGAIVKAKSNQADFFRNFTPANSELTGVGLIFDSNGQQVTAPNTFDGVAGISKIGPGTLILTAGNIYSGATDITGGTLLANNLAGSATGSGSVTVSGTGTLGGNGSIAGTVQVSAGGTVAPGASVGTLSAATVAFIAPSSFRVEIDDTTVNKADLLAVSGLLNITGATLQLSVTGTAAEPVYIIATYGARSGNFASFTGMPSGYVLDYDYAGGTAIALVQNLSDPYTAWIDSFGIANPADKAKGADPDRDGVPNVLEFALGGTSPINGGARPVILPSLDATNHFVATTLVRTGAFALFSGLPSPTTTPSIDNLTYIVEGTVDLVDWTKPMQTTTLPAGLPPAPLNYEWAAFRHTAVVTAPYHSSARVRVVYP